MIAMDRDDERLRSLLIPATPPAHARASALRLVEAVAERRLAERIVPALDIAATADGIASVGLGRGKTEAPTARARRLADQARAELTEYLGGERGYFSVPVDLGAVAEFQRGVLDATGAIPLGEVRTYAWVAARIGKPSAVRAVGNALGRNPVPLLVPCHRVVRTDGGMGGYSFGAPEVKEHLILLERATPALVGCTTTRVVCRHGCAHEMRIAERNRIVVASVAEARAIGYRPCAVCRPRD
jgi:O-6-methylguanine DNA methyltransferase